MKEVVHEPSPTALEGAKPPQLLPIRVRLSRAKGWRLPPFTTRCARPGKHGNPFRVGGYFMIGDPDQSARFFRMSWCEKLVPPYDGYTFIKNNEVAVEMFKRYASGWTEHERETIRRELGGRNLACWCALDAPCHADVLLEIANESSCGGADTESDSGTARLLESDQPKSTRGRKADEPTSATLA